MTRHQAQHQFRNGNPVEVSISVREQKPNSDEHVKIDADPEDALKALLVTRKPKK